jgi:hypothetical protein
MFSFVGKVAVPLLQNLIGKSRILINSKKRRMSLMRLIRVASSASLPLLITPLSPNLPTIPPHHENGESLILMNKERSLNGEKCGVSSAPLPLISETILLHHENGERRRQCGVGDVTSVPPILIHHQIIARDSKLLLQLLPV